MKVVVQSKACLLDWVTILTLYHINELKEWDLHRLLLLTDKYQFSQSKNLKKQKSIIFLFLIIVYFYFKIHKFSNIKTWITSKDLFHTKGLFLRSQTQKYSKKVAQVFVWLLMAGFKHLAAKPLLYIERGMCCVVYDPKFMFHWQHADGICVHYMDPVPVIHYFYCSTCV